MAEAKDKAKVPKQMDVAKPPKPSPANAHTLLTETPAENTGQPSDGEDSKLATTPSMSKVKLEPISKPEDLKPEAAHALDKKTAEPAATNDTSADGDTDGRDKLKDASQEEQELIAKKAAERQANLDKIAVAKTYYLPINQVVRRRSKHVAVAGAVLIVLLGVAWIDVSLDAGLISIAGVKAPTHFFSN